MQQGLSSHNPPGLVICGVVRRKNTAVKPGTRPTWRSGSRISPTVFPPPAAPPYMQMSAAVWRNAVCGPGCAEIVVLGDGDMVIRHPPRRSVWHCRAAGGVGYRLELSQPDQSARASLPATGFGCYARELCAGWWKLPLLPFPSKVFLLRLLQQLGQLWIAAVIGQDQNHIRIRPGIGVRARVVRGHSLPPMCPGLQPENHRRDVAGLRRREQKAGDRRVGLGYAAIELITKTLAQRLRGAADDFGDVVLRDTETGQVPHLLAQRIIDDKAVRAMCNS